MTVEKTQSPYPFLLLVFLFLLTAVLHQQYPAFFFPAVSAGALWGMGLTGTLVFGLVAVKRLGAITGQRKRALALIVRAVEDRQAVVQPDENDVINAGRYIARLVRNADEDLREIGADFSLASLPRLSRYLPHLLDEVGREEDAKIRLGVAGTYIGETLCRCSGWEWFYRADPRLKQFEYLTSILRRKGKTLDPYQWAGDLFARRHSIGALLKEAASTGGSGLLSQ